MIQIHPITPSDLYVNYVIILNIFKRGAAWYSGNQIIGKLLAWFQKLVSCLTVYILYRQLSTEVNNNKKHDNQLTT